MVSCPTSAITFKPVGKVKPATRDGSAEVMSAAELTRDPVFAGVPPKFLLWQQGLVMRRKLKAGNVLCRQGDAGNTAFIIKAGKLQATVYPIVADPVKGLTGQVVRNSSDKPVWRMDLTPANLIVGEMACLTGSPRAADVVALEAGEVWEVRRNVLDRLMRLPSQRARFEGEYRQRSLDLVLQGSDLFRGIAQEDYRKIVNYLRQRVSFVRVSPGQTVFRQGDAVNNLYLVRLGYVRIGIQRFQKEAKVLSRGPGTIFGEIGLLAFSADDVHKSVEEADRALASALENAGDDLLGAIPAGIRTATCSALGHLELARISRADFLEMLREFPVLRRRLVEEALSRLRSDDESNSLLRDYVEQGLYEGRSLLVLDLDLCTRCDECTKGCVEQHGTESHGVPLTRMLRDGLRFENYLIGTACRSCADPHCMVGCPVDSIHRGKHLQIVIEDHCIGCGLCADNCPYGNIFMVPNEHRRIDRRDENHPVLAARAPQPKAVTCDLCDAEGKLAAPRPRCVSSCPHEAAFRMSGEQLLERVLKGTTKRNGG
jgi:CRP-like cAMP-binding protein/Fe-S-cluster-containing hydrogenase component 2